MTCLKLGRLALAAMVLLASETALPDPMGNLQAEHALKGLSFDAAYVLDIVRNLDPGIVSQQRKTASHGLITLGATIDTGDIGWWKHGKLHVSAIHTHGGQPSANVIGDLQVSSNIESPHETLLYEAWYEQQFEEGRFSLLVGLHDLNTEFCVSDYASLFLNSSFGIGAEISANVPSSLFPRPGLGIRLRFQPLDTFSIALAGYDGDPTTRTLSKAEGQMDMLELAYRYGLPAHRPGTLKLGVWQHTGTITAPSGQPFARDYGGYLLIEQQLLGWGDAGTLGAFLRYGLVPNDRNEVISNLAAGMHLAGFLPGRPEDIAGFGMTRVDNQYAPGRRGAETTWEMTYQASFGDHIKLQPSFQWIQHPQGNPANRNVRVLIGRLMIDL